MYDMGDGFRAVLLGVGQDVLPDLVEREDS